MLSDDPANNTSRQWTERVTRFRSEIEASLQTLAAPLDAASATADEARAFDALRDILDAGANGGQREILRAVLVGGGLSFRRTILFIGRDDRLVGWERRGFGDTGPEHGDSGTPVTIAATGDHLAARARAAGALVVAGPQGPGEELAGALSGEVPIRSAAAPLRVRDRVVAVLYGDAREMVSGARLGLFELVARVGGLALELRSSRRRLSWAAETGALLSAPARDASDGQEASDRNPAAPEEAEMQALLGDIEALPRHDEGGGLSPEEQRQHNDARRFASLLVSELLLYNEEAVIQGRMQRDLSRRLAPEIERTRRAYEARIPSALRGGPQYLEDEFLRVLADGDKALLTV